jgi:microcin C transport system ATP-binding protein
MSLLTVRNLTVSFRQDGREIPAVAGVSFRWPGETVALVGESGSGKSVTALSTVGLLSDNATIRRPVTVEGPDDRRPARGRICAGCAATTSASSSRSR